MKNKAYMALLAAVPFILTGCTHADDTGNTSSIETALYSFHMEPLENRQDIPKLLLEYNFGYEDDIPYEITSPELEENTDYRIFKFSQSSASFLYYEDTLYQLGDWFGGCGLTSFAFADGNNDGKNEMYFTFSYGSGIHSQCASYFDPVQKGIFSLGGTVSHNFEWMISKHEDNSLYFHKGVLETYYNDDKGFAEVTLTSDDPEVLAQIVFCDGKPSFVSQDESMVSSGIYTKIERYEITSTAEKADIR